jgi:hypothetical protein
MEMERFLLKRYRKLAGRSDERMQRLIVAADCAALGYSLQANAKALEEGSQHPDRDEQFAHLNQQASKFMAAATAIGCDCGNGNCNT